MSLTFACVKDAKYIYIIVRYQTYYRFDLCLLATQVVDYLTNLFNNLIRVDKLEANIRFLLDLITCLKGATQMKTLLATLNFNLCHLVLAFGPVSFFLLFF